MQNDSTIERSSLGRILSLGDLYDARKDAYAGASIFNRTLPEASIESKDNPLSKVDYEVTDRISEKFHKLNVNAELQLSVLAGMIDLQGSGKYLQDEKVSAKASRMTLLYSIMTKSERISISNLELKDIIDLNVIDSFEATHVVVGIDWGANCTITSEYANQENAKKTEIEGLLKAKLDKVAYAISGEGQGNYEEKNNEYTNNFSFHSNCDVVTTDEEFPSTFQEVIEFVKKLPKLVREANNGKSKPLSYTLLPISSILAYFNYEKKIDLVLKQLKEESILRFVHLFEEISLVRQELYDLYQDVQLNSSCLSDQQFQLVTKLKNDFAITESSLRSELAENLVDVRSGKSEASKLDDLIKEFEEKEFSTVKIRDHLQSLNSLKEKIKHIKILLSKGIDYIGKSGSLDTKFMSAQNQEFYVLFLAWSKNNEPLWNENLRLFLSLVNTHSSNKERYGFIIVDCDLNPENTYKNPVIFHYVNGQSSCEDVLKMNKEDASLCLAQSNEIEDCLYPPNKRTPIELPCPGSLNGGICENLTHQWLCKKCRNPLEYGFDDYFYCSCGKGKTTSFQYRCNNPKHGSAFISYTKQSLKNYLEAMRPMKEINILILGETGVGKSTWINAFANYVMYNKFQYAEQGELINMISAKFTITDDDYNETLITIGQDSNESSVEGQSATQYPTAHSFFDGDKRIRFIDTPGIGDTRGVEQDKENMTNIISFLSNYDEIHGICILLKPDNSRLGVMFRFCIKELLTHLHKSAAQNIIFCFTNSRTTFYRPGNTLPGLKKLLTDNLDVDISLSKRTMYCMDNESFRFLALLKHGYTFDDDTRKNFSASWDHSVVETERLLEHIASLKPHKVSETISLNYARNLVVILSRPIAEISRDIQTNIFLLQERDKEIQLADGSIEELKKELYTPITKIESKTLDNPRTVCTSPKCVDVISGQDGMSRIHYRTHCHPHCGLRGVAVDVVNNVALQGCSAMDSNNNCTVCGCEWFRHMHITYETYQVQVQVIDEDINKRIKTKKDYIREKEKKRQEYNVLIQEYREEQKIITDASARFAYFLKENAITAYNDALGDHLEHLIREEEQKSNAGGGNQTLQNLQRIKREYDEEVKILETNMKSGKGGIITPKDIKDLEKKLLNLKHQGKKLQDLMVKANARQSNPLAQIERTMPTPKSKGLDGSVSGFSDAITGIGNTLQRWIGQK